MSSTNQLIFFVVRKGENEFSVRGIAWPDNIKGPYYIFPTNCRKVDNHSFLIGKISAKAHEKESDGLYKWKYGRARSIRINLDDETYSKYVNADKKFEFDNNLLLEDDVFFENSVDKINSNETNSNSSIYSKSDDIDSNQFIKVGDLDYLTKVNKSLMRAGIIKLDIKANNIESWIVNFEQALSKIGIEIDDSLIKLVPKFLDESLVTWYYTNEIKDTFTTWTAFKKDLTKQYLKIYQNLVKDVFSIYNPSTTISDLMKSLRINDQEVDTTKSMTRTTFVYLKSKALKELFPELKNSNRLLNTLSLTGMGDDALFSKIIKYTTKDNDTFVKILSVAEDN